MRDACLPLLVAACLAIAADAAGETALHVRDTSGSAVVTARLVAHPDETGAAAPRVGVLLDVAPGWHVYDADPGELGVPTTLAWRAAGATPEPLAWPPSERFEDAGGMGVATGYAGRVLLAARLVFGDAGRAAPRDVAVDVSLVACAHECIPAELTLSGGLPPAAPPDAALEAELRERFAAAVPPAPPAVPLSLALALALLGGAILNLMPCVLPVLALKLVALAEHAGETRGAALRRAGAYAAGVLGSMALLGLAVIAARRAGSAVGWGFQFQEPLYLAALAALLVLFAANLFGAFEIGAGAARLAGLGAASRGLRRDALDGLLAVALATPCSAPFLGTAVGVAFASDDATALAIFLAIGLGLSAPVFLVAASPGFARRLPRSGAWMGELRAALGFALLLSVAWLVWVARRLLDADALAALVAALVALAAASAAWGALQRRGLQRAGGGALAAAGALALLGGGAVGWRPGEAELAHAAYHPAALSEALAGGRPALVVFTADWCVTCKFNERWVLADVRVRDALAEQDAVVLVADWTRRDETIRAELARHGRAGVPLTLVYSPRDPTQPRRLPELLTVPLVLEAVGEAGAAVTRITPPAREASMHSKVRTRRTPLAEEPT